MSRALIVLNTDHDRELAASWARQAKWGTRIEFKSSNRSLPQNDRLWACLTEIARQVEWYGTKLSPDDWKDVFTAALRRARVVPGIDAGTFVPLGMRTSDMTKEEFSDLLELINAFAAERGVVFKDQESPEESPPAGEGSADAAHDGTPDLSAQAAEPEAGAPEAGHDGAAGPASGVQQASDADKRECLDKFLFIAAEDLPLDDRRKNIEFAKDCWKRDMPTEADFVKACMTTADKVAKGELAQAAARKYLEGLI